MRRKIEKMLRDDLDRLAPPLSPELNEAPLPGPERRSPSPRPRRRLVWLSAVLAAVAAVCIIVPTAVLSGNRTTPAGVSVIVFDVNPSVRLVADESGLITAVSSANDDGDLLLAGGFAALLQGLSAEEACARLTDRAVRLGFLSDGGAVRLRVANDSRTRADALAQSAAEAAGGQLRQMGIYAAAFGTAYAPGTLAELYGLAADDGSTLADAVSALPTLVLDARNAAVTEESLVSDYLDAFSAYAVSVTDTVYDTLRAKKEALAALNELNEEIEAHPDNPGLLLRDYWSIGNRSDLTADLAALTERMRAALDDFEAAYGQKPNDKFGFSVLWGWYEMLDTDRLRADCEALIADFRALAESLGDLFSALAGQLAERVRLLAAGDEALASAVDEAFTTLTALPETPGEYAEKTAEMLVNRAAAREISAADYYNADRAQIGAEAYAEYLQTLIDEYGSLENYFLSRQ